MTCPARRSRTNRALRSSVRSRIPWVRGAQTVPRRRTPGRCGTVTHLLPTTKRSKRIDYYRAKGEGPKGVGAFSCRLVLICDIRMRGSRPAVPRSQRRDSTASARSGARSARSAGGRPVHHEGDASGQPGPDTRAGAGQDPGRRYQGAERRQLAELAPHTSRRPGGQIQARPTVPGGHSRTLGHRARRQARPSTRHSATIRLASHCSRCRHPLST